MLFAQRAYHRAASDGIIYQPCHYEDSALLWTASLDSLAAPIVALASISLVARQYVPRLRPLGLAAGAVFVALVVSLGMVTTELLARLILLSRMVAAQHENLCAGTARLTSNDVVVIDCFCRMFLDQAI